MEIVVWVRSAAGVFADLGYCKSLCVADDGVQVIITDKGFRADVYEPAVVVPTGKLRRPTGSRGQAPQTQSFNGDATLAAIGCQDGWVQLFDIK